MDEWSQADGINKVNILGWCTSDITNELTHWLPQTVHRFDVQTLSFERSLRQQKMIFYGHCTQTASLQSADPKTSLLDRELAHVTTMYYNDVNFQYVSNASELNIQVKGQNTKYMRSEWWLHNLREDFYRYMIYVPDNICSVTAYQRRQSVWYKTGWWIETLRRYSECSMSRVNISCTFNKA